MKPYLLRRADSIIDVALSGPADGNSSNGVMKCDGNLDSMALRGPAHSNSNMDVAHNGPAQRTDVAHSGPAQ